MATVAEEIERIKSMDTSKLNESTAKTAVVLPVLRALGWDTSDPDEVHLEYQVAKRLKGFADIALLSQDAPLILIETKAPHCSLEIEQHQVQLLEYCQMVQVRIGVLTNGLEWRIYYLETGADKNSSLAETIDLAHGRTEDSAKTFRKLLSRDVVSDKRALTHAKRAWHNSILSSRWKDLLAQGDKSLIIRLRKEVKEKCQVNILLDDVKKFIVARSTIPNTTEGTSITPVDVPQGKKKTITRQPTSRPARPAGVPQGKHETVSPSPKSKRSLRVRARVFGVESEFRSAREVMQNFVLQACRQNNEKLESLMQHLKSDGKRLIMVYSNEKPSLLRDPKKIGETNYWLETHFPRKVIKEQCNRIRQALSLPEDTLVWIALPSFKKLED